MTEINRYVIRGTPDGEGNFLLAYSEKDFPIGANVNVLHHTRFDGDIWESGYITYKSKQRLIDGKLPPVWEDKQPLRIGTVDIVPA